MSHNPGKQRHLVMCGVLIGVMAWSTALAASPSHLKGIELNSTPLETKITLNAYQSIPYRIVSHSSEKIVVDLDSINPTQSIQTDFATADNIDQVIIKPLGSRRVRMVIRGEHLSEPTVSTALMNRPRAGSVRTASVVFEQETGNEPAIAAKPVKKSTVNTPTEEGFALTGVSSEPAAKPVISEEQMAPSTDGVAMTSVPVLEEPSLTESSIPADSEAGADVSMPNTLFDDAATSDRKALIAPDEVEEIQPMEEEATMEDVAMASLSAAVEQAWKQVSSVGLFQGIIGLGLLMLLGAWLRKKRSPRHVFLDEEPRGLGQILSGLFPKQKRSAGRSRNRQRLFDAQGPAAVPARVNKRPVGLSGLNTPVEPLSTTGTSPLLARQQALSQYEKTGGMIPGGAPDRRNSRDIDLELKRSLQARHATHASQARTNNAKPPLKPLLSQQASNQKASGASSKKSAATPPPRMGKPASPPPVMKSPTPGHQQMARQTEPNLPANNTEVLDFLRSVAELMEQDGQPDLAKNVKRGMSSHFRS